MSTLYVDTINEKTSGNGVQIPGHVVQVVQSVKTNQSSSTSSSWSDTGLSASITPTSSSNKILVLVDVMFSHQPGYAGSNLRLLRDATTIYYGTGTGFAGFAGAYDIQNGADYVSLRTPANYLDSPASTSSLTYKVQFQSLQSAYIGINRTQRVNGTYDPAGASSITLMEIAQ
jgi:hypothetical protein